MMGFTQTEILEQLDAYAEADDFPILDNVHVHYGGVHLHAYASASKWALVFDSLTYCSNIAEFCPFVDCLSKSGYSMYTSYCGRKPLDSIGTHSMRIRGDEFRVTELDFKVLVNGSVRTFMPSRDVYHDLGIDLDDHADPPFRILCFLEDTLGDELFATSDELVKLCGLADEGMTELLHLKRYYHPDRLNDELPSDTETFQMIADVLVRRDASAYMPTEVPNNRWCDRKRPY